MENLDKYIIDDLLINSQKVLDELGEIDDLISGNQTEFEDNVTGSAINKFREDENEGVNFQAGGYVELRASDDKMYLTADFFPPSEGQNPLSYDEVIVRLTNRGVVFGINDKKIRDTVFDCNTKMEPVTNVLIAQGKFPEPEVAEHYVIEEDVIMRKRIPGKKENIDYKNVSPFILVKKGSLLAKHIPRKEGKDGSNIYGETIEHRIKKIPVLNPGKNTKEVNGAVYAACDGRFEQKGNDFYINEVLQIEKDVDYRTGNINFPGDVVIGGNIKDGFRISSGGSIFTKKTLDASDINCEGDLNVQQGIIGRKNASVKVGGSIRAKFIENCYVEAKDNVYLEAGAINSAIYTSGRMELGGKGVIVGGTVHAQNGVTAVQIGSQMGPRTEIYCGTDYKIANKLEWIRDSNMKLATKLNKIDMEIKKNNITEGQLLEIRGKLKESISKLNILATTLVYKLDKNDSAEIVVSGKIYPGVYMEICHISYVVNREMSASRFRLDKERGIITVSSV